MGNNIDLRLGDCLEVLKTIPDNSIDSVVTDSPYGLSFMGKKWDYDVPSVEVWTECLRVLKPGGVIMWNVADQTIKGSRTGNSMRQALYFMDLGLLLHDHLIWEKTETPFITLTPISLVNSE
jgi:DNA modification methylase